MTNKETSRRAVLTTIGSIGATTLIGTSQAEQPDTVRVVEVFESYDLPEGKSYQKFHHDSLPAYTIDEENSEIIPRPDVTDLSEGLGVSTTGDRRNIKKSDAITLNAEEKTGLVTRTTTATRTAESVSLASPVSLPEVTLRINNRNTVVTSPEGRTNVSTGEQSEVNVDVGEVTVETLSSGTELVDNPEVPKGQRSVKMKKGTVDVDATMRLEVRDHGDLRVKQRSKNRVR